MKRDRRSFKTTEWLKAPAWVLDNDGQPSGLEIQVKRAGVAEMLARENMFSESRLDLEKGVRVIRFEEGTWKLETILLLVAKWNLEEDSGRMWPITEANIKELISPSEFKWMYSECLKHNPQWFSGDLGEEEKNS